MKDNSLLKIYIKFAKVGAMTFGGGYAMLPILEREVVGESVVTTEVSSQESTVETADKKSSKTAWVTSEEVLDYYAVAQSLPGIIAINVASIIGHKVRGVLGGIVAALGVMSPCILIITIIAALLDGFRDNAIVAHALSGISICVVALIVSSIIKLWKKGVTDIPQFLICLITLSISIFTSVSPVFCIIGAGVVGVLLRLIFKGNDTAASALASDSALDDKSPNVADSTERREDS